MSRAETVTKLPLAVWAKIMGIHPLHFEQVRIEGLGPFCGGLVFQHEWQTSDAVSREEIARAIADAEAKIENALGYRLAPSWEVDEWRPTVRPYRPEFVNYFGSDIRGYKQTVDANWGYFISGGIQSKTLIEAAATIVYTDRDNDLYFETATVTVTTVALDKNEICIFYPGNEGDDSWEIRPIEVVIAGGIATITFRRELAIIPEKLELYDIEGAEAIGDQDEDFLEEVDVYRRYNDPQSQVSFLWEPLAGGNCASCNGGGCSSCAYATQTGCLIVRGDPRNSLVGYTPGSWDIDANDFTQESWAMDRQPDITRLYYYAGWRNKSMRYTNRMDPEWERIVAYMAAAMLDRPPCSCIKDTWDNWREDYLHDEFGKPYYPRSAALAYGDELNTFGTRRGEVNAWRKVQQVKRMRSVPL